VDESHSSPGNGVGLSIVKSVVELHHGQVSVDCKDGITTFCVKIAVRQ
jgi:signal transduction histidine kinase